MSTFKLNDYDCVGFDLDHTLLWYNVTNMVNMEYQVISKYLVTKKNYNPDYLQKPLTPKDIDFMQKGLILDFDRGNILKPDSRGIIQQVNHGRKSLTLDQINSVYPNQRWEPLDVFIKNPLDVWEGPYSQKMRSLLDYFDMPASLAFARAVDDIDSRNEEIKKYQVWNDILEAASDMYERGQFKKNLGEYFPNLKADPDKYLRKCSEEIIFWLKELKKTKITFLVTGSNADFADFTSRHVLGEDWKSLFDVVVCFAKKPGFFTGSRPFLALEGYEEAQEISGDKLARGGIYSQGNWKELKELFARITGKLEPKCLYFGDNLIQDIFVPSGHAGLDSVVVSEEMHAEGMDHLSIPHPDAQFMVSNHWGSYFSVKINDKKNEKSYWSFLIENYSKLCIPSIKIIAKNPIDKVYQSFDNDLSKLGYYPAKPSGL